MSSLKIYQYWDKGKNFMPPIIKYIFEHNSRLSKKYNFELVLISKNNIRQYLNNINDEFFELDPNHQSDICRFNILHRYGGVWLDSDVILLKNIKKYFEVFAESNKEMMLDIEFDNKIGCATIFAKKNSECTNFCINYLSSRKEQIETTAKIHSSKRFWDSLQLDYFYTAYRKIITNKSLNKKIKYFFGKNLSNKELKWGTLGPDLVTKLYESHRDKIHLNDKSTVKNGCNFITWVDQPGLNSSKWLFSDSKSAYDKAKKLNSNTYYVITWTLYKLNTYKNADEAISTVFRNKNSVFYHLISFSENQNKI